MNATTEQRTEIDIGKDLQFCGDTGAFWILMVIIVLAAVANGKKG